MKILKGCLQQLLLGPLLNTLSHMWSVSAVRFRKMFGKDSPVPAIGFLGMMIFFTYFINTCFELVEGSINSQVVWKKRMPLYWGLRVFILKFLVKLWTQNILLFSVDFQRRIWLGTIFGSENCKYSIYFTMLSRSYLPWSILEIWQTFKVENETSRFSLL